MKRPFGREPQLKHVLTKALNHLQPSPGMILQAGAPQTIFKKDDQNTNKFIP